MRSFITERWGDVVTDYDKLRQRVTSWVKSYLEEVKTGDLLEKPGQGKNIPGGHRCRVVNPQERVRRPSLTRPVNKTKMPELGHELYQWWVDLSQVLQARVPNALIFAQAKLMIEDAIRCWDAEREAGGQPPVLLIPIINYMWLCRWRKSRLLVPRQLTCTYKVSYANKLRRLGVLWRNATRLLVFHAALFGPGHLTFMSMDEKPYRFNACGGDKVWAFRGCQPSSGSP